MKIRQISSSFFIFFTFLLTINIQAQSDRPRPKYEDPMPQKPITLSQEREFWESINSTLIASTIDSSTTRVKKYVALFEGVRMQVQIGKTPLQAVRKWYLIQEKIIVMFTDSGKISFSFTNLGEEYKKINITIISTGGTETKKAYTPNNIQNLTLKI